MNQVRASGLSTRYLVATMANEEETFRNELVEGVSGPH